MTSPRVTSGSSRSSPLLTLSFLCDLRALLFKPHSLAFFSFVILIPTDSKAQPQPDSRTWIERMRTEADADRQAAEHEVGDIILQSESDLDRLRTDLDRRARELATRAETTAKKDLTDLDAWASETATLIENSQITLDAETGLLELARDVESDIDTEYEKVRRELAPTLAEADAWIRKTKREVENEALNVAEEGLSDARAILRDLANKSPKPVPAPTVAPIDSALSDVAIPMRIDEFPDNPGPYIAAGNPFFAPGYIGTGFEFPTGTMIQPQSFLYGTFTSGVQTFDDGVTDRTTQWVNSLQLFGNFNATPTERLFIEFRPLDNTADFSGYNFEPTTGPDSGWQNALNGRVYQLFFEGNFLSIFPGLDNGTNYLLGFDFTVGRQLLFLQSGILINDTIDLVGVTHPSLFTFGSSAATASLIYAWGNIHRSGGLVSDTAQLLGGYLRGDFLTSTVELDLFYGTANQAAGGDGFYAAASSIQRFGKFNTNFTVAGSIATNRLDPEQTTVNNGGLLFAQISTDYPGTENILYLDAFWAIERFTSASRAADAGGALGQTGLLFAATGLGDFGAALGSTATNSAGASFGYQMFFDDYRKQLILEVGAQTETIGPTQKSVAAGFQYEQAIGQNWTVTAGAIGALQDQKRPLYGLRLQLDFNF